MDVHLDPQISEAIANGQSLCCISRNQSYEDAYCAHLIDRVKKSRARIFENKKLLEKTAELTDELIETTRDQGFSRPSVLILTPYKKFAHQIVHRLVTLMVGNRDNLVMHLKRFDEEYGDTGNRIHPKWRATEEYKELFSGNIEDSFHLPISLGKKGVKLYTSFENADIIIASPLALGMKVEGNEEKDAVINFLSSIETLIIDRADILIMQNWDHLDTLLGVVNEKPTNIETDINRVLPHFLAGEARSHRQTLLFSDKNFLELHVLLDEHDANRAGMSTFIQAPRSILSQIEVPIVQELHRFGCENVERQSDIRFNYFTRNILPKLKVGTLIFISSYFDYIRLRQYLKKDNESFVQIHEDATDSRIRKSRKAFANHEKKLLLMTERCHFFRHFVVSGTKSVVFYQLPINLSFYPDIINMVRDEEKIHCQVIYSKYDALRLQNIFGPAYAKQLLQSDKMFHAICSE